MSSSVDIDNKGKDILILGEGPTQELNDTTLTAEVKYPIMEAKVSCLLMLQKILIESKRLWNKKIMHCV